MRLAALMLAVLATPALAAPAGASWGITAGAPLQQSTLHGRMMARRAIDPGPWRVRAAPSRDYTVVTATSATAAAVAVRPVPLPVSLALEPLGGRRAFATMTALPDGHGWQVWPTASRLGVGVTGAWGIAIAPSASVTPFISVDYDRIDTARFVDARSPRPYINDNADTGLTLTAGTQVSWLVGSRQRLRLGGYGALVAGSAGSPREAASVGARIVQSLGDSRLQPLHGDVGAQIGYALSPRTAVSGVVAHSIARSGSDTLAVRIGLAMRY